MAKRNELAVWREKMASGGFVNAIEAAVALDQIARRRMSELSEAYDAVSMRGGNETDEYINGACDLQANILRGIVTGFR